MKTLTISEKQAEKKISRILTDMFPKMPVNAMYKAFRKKDIKVNGIRVKENYILNAGDILDVYISDAILGGLPTAESPKTSKGFIVVYEDKNILIVNKQQGISVHADKEEAGTLLDYVQDYLAIKGEYSPDSPDSFPPSLCHRLDRNTGGLVLIAKNKESLKIMLDKIKNREIKKYYQCLVKGKMENDQALLKAYLIKDERKSKVFISNTKLKDSLEIITKYKVLAYDYDNDISKLEIELVTGRTHQIRAHLAHIGHTIIGDGKYGTNAINRPLGLKYQALWAYKIFFNFNTDSGILEYLKGRSFKVEPELPRLK
jgi:23S rRNA pseudouridine955/2504/2580 synthase